MVLGQLAAAGGSGVAKAMGGVESSDPRLQRIAREAAAAVGVKAPRIFEIKSREANAFAATSLFARDPTVAVTSGLREVLSEDELGAVLAHEMGHLRHRDVLRNMHVAAAAAGLGGIYDVGRMLLEGSTSRRRRKSKKSDDEGSGAALGVALMAGGLATQGLAHGFRLVASRQAELKADRAAAEAYGANTMIRALQKIDAAAARRPADLRAHRAGKNFAFAMISAGPSAKPSSPSPGRSAGGGQQGMVGRFFSGLGNALRTHPPLDRRVQALEEAAAAGLVPARHPHSSWL